MKKTFSTLAAIVLLSGVSFGQGIYIKAGGGYGFPAGTGTIGQEYLRTEVSNIDGTVYTNSVEMVKGSYGAGMNFNLALGYKFNENFIFELGAQYLVGNKHTEKDNYTYTSDSYSYVDNDVIETSAKALFINPSFVFSAGFGKAAPYGRFGVVLGSPKIKGVESTYYDGDGTYQDDLEWEYSTGLALGFQGAIGMNWKLSEKMDFFTEVNFLSMAYYPGEYNLTKSTTTYDQGDPNDNLPNMYEYNKKVIYEKKFDPTAVNIDLDKPRTELPEAFPFSSISAQVGIRFALWSKQ